MPSLRRTRLQLSTKVTTDLDSILASPSLFFYTRRVWCGVGEIVVRWRFTFSMITYVPPFPSSIPWR